MTASPYDNTFTRGMMANDDVSDDHKWLSSMFPKQAI